MGRGGGGGGMAKGRQGQGGLYVKREGWGSDRPLSPLLPAAKVAALTEPGPLPWLPPPSSPLTPRWCQARSPRPPNTPLPPHRTLPPPSAQVPSPRPPPSRRWRA